ncbi:hypothetical protein [Agarilytica rhodophyticola]|uniref:hypothetical protein n=1 Tax=Agarilytica rhodophyticola TaxID=1737490 RepID=UPI000B348526|nr:hypothetical protein [Agarilytica rhodophyticola]
MCRIVRCVCWCLAIFILITPFLESLEKDPVTFINHGAEFSFVTQPSFDTDNVDVVDVKFDINSTQQLLLFLIFLFSPVLFLFILFHVERLFSNLQVGE